MSGRARERTAFPFLVISIENFALLRNEFRKCSVKCVAWCKLGYSSGLPERFGNFNHIPIYIMRYYVVVGRCSSSVVPVHLQRLKTSFKVEIENEHGELETHSTHKRVCTAHCFDPYQNHLRCSFGSTLCWLCAILCISVCLCVWVCICKCRAVYWHTKWERKSERAKRNACSRSASSCNRSKCNNSESARSGYILIFSISFSLSFSHWFAL